MQLSLKKGGASRKAVEPFKGWLIRRPVVGSANQQKSEDSNYGNKKNPLGCRGGGGHVAKGNRLCQPRNDQKRARTKKKAKQFQKRGIRKKRDTKKKNTKKGISRRSLHNVEKKPWTTKKKRFVARGLRKTVGSKGGEIKKESHPKTSRGASPKEAAFGQGRTSREAKNAEKTGIEKNKAQQKKKKGGRNNERRSVRGSKIEKKTSVVLWQGKQAKSWSKTTK